MGGGGEITGLLTNKQINAEDQTATSLFFAWERGVAVTQHPCEAVIPSSQQL